MIIRVSVPSLVVVSALGGCLLEPKSSGMETSEVGATATSEDSDDGPATTGASGMTSASPSTSATSDPDSTTSTSGPSTTTASPTDPGCDEPQIVFDFGPSDVNPTCLQPTDADVWMYAVVEGSALVRVAIADDGSLDVQPVCDIDTTMADITAFAVAHNEDVFFISDGNTKDWFRLCLCEPDDSDALPHPGVDALTFGVELFGLSTQHDSLVHFDEWWDGDTELFGDLGGRQFESGALTWSEAESSFYAALDPGPAAPTEFVRLDAGGCGATHLFDLDVDEVDMAIHHGSNRLFACLGDAHLYEILDNGTITDLGDMGVGDCHALASGEDYW